jgi:hypothetical protein
VAVIPKGTRGQGFKGSSEMLTNYKDIEERHQKNRKYSGLDNCYLEG